MPAISSDSSRATHSRLPLTPKVMSSRRGGHLVTRRAQTPVEAGPASVTPAMHVTPNVVSAVRGGLNLRSEINFTDAYKAGALDMRGLRL